jgi:hypothetical protein
LTQVALWLRQACASVRDPLDARALKMMMVSNASGFMYPYGKYCNVSHTPAQLIDSN